MSTAATTSTLIIQTTRKPNPLLSAMVAAVLGAVGWAVAAVFMLIAWPYHGIASSPEASVFYPMIFPVFGFVSGALLGCCIGWVAAVADRAVEPRMGGPPVGILVGVLVGACAGALTVGVMLLWEWGTVGQILQSMLGHVGFLRRPLLIQLLTGILPGVVCGIAGARPQTTTTATCAACGGPVPPDATHCKHCGAAFGPVNMRPRQRRNLRWLALLGALLGLFGIAKWLQAPSTVAVPELDAYVLDVGKVKGNRSKAELAAVLGEPPLVYQVTGGEDAWAYPIRRGNWSLERATPAPMLEVTLDQAGQVVEWGFFHPLTHERLPVHETLAEAHQWFDERDVGPEYRIDLATVLKKGTTKQEVLLALAGPSRNLPYDPIIEESYLQAVEPIFVRPAATGAGEVLRFYVDHPSPLLMAPAVYVRRFDKNGYSAAAEIQS